MAENNNEDRNKTWLENNKTIGLHLMKFYAEHKRQPKLKELAELTGLSYVTVQNHMANAPVDVYREEQKAVVRSMGDQIVMAVVNSALKGNTRAMEMALALGLDWSSAQMEINVNNQIDTNITEEKLEYIVERLNTSLMQENQNLKKPRNGGDENQS